MTNYEEKEKQTPEDYKRKIMMYKLSEMPYEVIATAYLYAVNYIAYGEDVTKEWPTVIQQTQALEKAYQKGYYDAWKERIRNDNCISDVLTVSFDSGIKDEAALCVSRKQGDKIIMLKMESGKQADILYHLLTEQTAKAEIKTEREA